MIILDTNVVSEPMRAQVDQGVRDWLDRQAAGTLYLTTVSLAELMVGIELLPDGRRKHGMAEGLNDLLETLFGPRILSFDRPAAIAYAPIQRRARERGQHISFDDGQIAAIALHHGFAIATRDTTPFQIAGVLVINPFEAPAPAQK